MGDQISRRLTAVIVVAVAVDLFGNRRSGTPALPYRAISWRRKLPERPSYAKAAAGADAGASVRGAASNWPNCHIGLYLFCLVSVEAKRRRRAFAVPVGLVTSSAAVARAGRRVRV